ncbi:MAG: hypothetical protein ISS26_04600 [Candidatus Omnitrophica bacterium]|nr:hypothetical protein [Candidatus Omnitrophota bacterium]
MKKKIPKLKRDKELIAFWNAHDFTDYIEDTEPADDVVFEKARKETVSFRLRKEQIKDLKRIAHKVGLGYTALIRSWITERLARIQGMQHHQR